MIKIAYNEKFSFELPEGHKFPISKYYLIPETLLKEKTISENNLFSPSAEEKDIVTLTHSSQYIQRMLSGKLSEVEIRRIGFPYTERLVEREFMITRGTREGAEYALQFGIALNSAGGTHHAYSDRGEGFCLLNDVAVASNYLLRTKKVKKILIVDLDVHQGNGTAKIFEKEERVFTFSMHGANNFPLHKETSDLDISLPSGVKDFEYLSLLSDTLPQLIESIRPDFIFYIAGVDVLETDRWGHLSLTLEGVKQRDEFVLKTARHNRIPIFITMGGGYSPDIGLIVEAHCNTYRSAFEIFC